MGLNPNARSYAWQQTSSVKTPFLTGSDSRSSTALLLLGLYIAVFLVMAAMVHVMTSYDASAEIGLPADLLTPAAANATASLRFG